MRIGRCNVLNGLATVSRYVDANDGLLEFGIRRPDDGVVGVLEILQTVETFQHELEQCDQIFGMR